MFVPVAGLCLLLSFLIKDKGLEQEVVAVKSDTTSQPEPEPTSPDDMDSSPLEPISNPIPMCTIDSTHSHTKEGNVP